MPTIEMKQPHWHKWLLAAGTGTLLVLLTACTTDDLAAPAAAEVTIAPTSGGTRAEDAATRATVTGTEADLRTRELRIDAYYDGSTTPHLDGAQLRYDGGTWHFADPATGATLHYLWPLAGSVPTALGTVTSGKLDFVGTAPYEQPAYIKSRTYTASDGPQFTCDMSSYMTADAQRSLDEYLLACSPDKSGPEAVPLGFVHPFATVSLALTACSPGVTNITVTFKSLKTGGICTLAPDGTLAWTDLSGAKDFTASEDHNFDLYTTFPQTFGGPYLMVPQTFTNDKVQLDVSFTIAGATTPRTATGYVSMPSGWQAGHAYTYNLAIEDNTILINAEVDDTWRDRAKTGATVTPTN